MRTIGNGGGRWLTSIVRSASWSDIDCALHAGFLVAGDCADVLVDAGRRGGEFEGRRLAGLCDRLERAGRLVRLHGWKAQVVLDHALVLEGDRDLLADLRLNGPRGELQVRGN